MVLFLSYQYYPKSVLFKIYITLSIAVAISSIYSGMVWDYSYIYFENIVNLEPVPIYGQFGPKGRNWNNNKTMSLDPKFWK